MALVNRKPHGRPGHDHTNAPQNAAWLAALAFAEREVYIQTPTFNAPLVVEGVLEAVRRGVEVTIFADLGFNDECAFSLAFLPARPRQLLTPPSSLTL